eukprot:5302290-Amphidinium_carterae.1
MAAASADRVLGPLIACAGAQVFVVMSIRRTGFTNHRAARTISSARTATFAKMVSSSSEKRQRCRRCAWARWSRPTRSSHVRNVLLHKAKEQHEQELNNVGHPRVLKLGPLL